MFNYLYRMYVPPHNNELPSDPPCLALTLRKGTIINQHTIA